jgi:16S rRNA (guanine527-N7)-methyltransferase
VKLWGEIAELAGFALDQTQIELLETYRDWLRSEALPAGGLGPAEGDRLDERHIADSLLFATSFSDVPESIADLGSGVGLPGIPLAVLWPETRMHLIDRSEKRIDLMRRACRVLGLANTETYPTDVTRLRQRFSAIVSRGMMPPDQLGKHIQNLLLPGGLAVVGGSWTSEPVVPDWETRQILPEMLDRAVWLLIMRRQ